MLRPAQDVLADHMRGIVAGVQRFESSDKLFELRLVLSGIRLLLNERGDGSIYKELNLTNINVLSTLIKPSVLPRPDAIDSTFTGITSSNTATRASAESSVFREFIPLDEWWEGTAQVIEGNPLSRKQVVLASQTDGMLHQYPMREKGVRALARRDALHFQYIKQYGYELGNSPELLRLTNLTIDQLWRTENSQ